MPLPPIFFAQRKFPFGSSFQIKASQVPDAVSGKELELGSKSVFEPVNQPTLYILPNESSFKLTTISE